MQSHFPKAERLKKPWYNKLGLLVYQLLKTYKFNSFITIFLQIWSLSPFAIKLDFLVEEYAGGKGHIPPKKRRRKNSIYMATIEKGLALIRSLIELDRLNEIGLIVVWLFIFNLIKCSLLFLVVKKLNTLPFRPEFSLHPVCIVQLFSTECS